jgi:sec-independent protein translocase protein TatC
MADEQTAPDPQQQRKLGQMSFMDHLGELRTRIMWSLVSVGVALVIALFITDPVMRYIALPVTRLKNQLYVTTATEGIWTYMKVALFLSVFISMPALLWQVWKFVAPGLHEHEKKYALPFVLSGSLMFFLGGSFALVWVLPYAVPYLISFSQERGWGTILTLASYTDFVIKFVLAFGLVFELPIVITLLAMLGVVTSSFLAKNRKYAILINFVLAAILTPTPDVFNQTLMAAPMCLLYEVGIFSAWVVGRKRRKRQDEKAAAAAPSEEPVEK